MLSLLISDQHVGVPQRQQRTNTNTNVPSLDSTYKGDDAMAFGSVDISSVAEVQERAKEG